MRVAVDEVRAELRRAYEMGQPGGGFEIYRACKEIDGAPKGFGTPHIFGPRVTCYYGFGYRQKFYEVITQYDRLLDLMRLKEDLLTGGAPEWAVGHMTVCFEVFESAHTAPQGRLTMPLQGEKSLGLHVVALWGWEDSGDSLVFLNSWGRRWGRQGLGSISREYFDQHFSDAYRSCSASVGLTRFTWERFVTARDSRSRAKAWMQRNPRWEARFRFSGGSLRLINYEVLSGETDEPVDVFELRNGLGLRVAWAYLFHFRAQHERRCELREFYVWPRFRRLGYGTELEAAVVHRARQAGARNLKAWFHVADAALPLRRAGRTFAAERGYQIQWRSSERPPLAGRAVKAI
jgi:GNAT superfamily N-acetyltransferase